MTGLGQSESSLEFILLFSAILLVLSVLASRISSSFGVPALLLFLGIGMLAGSEGPGNLYFDDYPLAFAVGSVCLIIILFDGGMRTSWRHVRPILPLGASLSFFGTVVTGLTTGSFAHFVLDLSWIEGLILGAIVSSTDAAAVFSILRARSLSLKGSLKYTLEFEAGSNDPVAIFLTVGFLAMASSGNLGFSSLIVLLATQGGIGLAAGWLGGQACKWLINHVGIEHEGLYGVLLMGLTVCLFSITAIIGGSGFLAVYVAGLFLGSVELLHKGSILRFMDGIAWIAQILVFLTLGLLVFPSHLLPVWKEGIVLALFLMFVARPLSVLIAAPGASLRGRERLFVSWVGLRGAAPVILATLPWGASFPKAEYFFNLVFFVVLISVMLQGITIPMVARAVGVTEPLSGSSVSELSAGLLPAGFVAVEIEVRPDSDAANKKVVELPLPAGVLLTSLQRERRYLIPSGDTVVAMGDRIHGLARRSSLKALKKLFGEARAAT